MQAQILRRALEVRRPGQYIGLWEFLCWCAWRETKCNILFLEGAVDIVGAYAPQIMTHPWPGGTCPHAVVACRRAEGGADAHHAEWVPSSTAGLSHYVAGLRMGCSMAAAGRDVTQHCLQHGFAPVMTVCNGDCGIDA